VLRTIFGLKRGEVTGGCRKLLNEELYNLYSLPSIIRMMKSMRIRWAGDITRMGRKRMYKRFWWEARKKETPRKT
jgi:hypothetical protein